MVYMIIAIDSLVSKSKHVIAIHGRSLGANLIGFNIVCYSVCCVQTNLILSVQFGFYCDKGGKHYVGH